MDQPPNPNPPRGARPQLFSVPADKKPGAPARGQADFGPSILATIDGGQSRMANTPDRSALKRTLVLAVLAMSVAAVYLSLKFSDVRPEAAPAVEIAAVAPVAVPVAAKPVEPAVVAASQPEGQGAAAIETVALAVSPAAASAPAADQPLNVAASQRDIQQTLERSEPAPAPKAKPASKSVAPVRTATAPKTTAKPTKAPQRDTDADLLAAMLPHLARGAGSTSPAYERRCGQLTGDAAAECRAKFCNGREGVDAACPVIPATQK